MFTKPFKTGMSLDVARGRDSWCLPKGARPLGTRIVLLRRNKGDFCLRMREKLFYFYPFVNALRERTVFGAVEFDNRIFGGESLFNRS